jgi:hypothetical protein
MEFTKHLKQSTQVCIFSFPYGDEFAFLPYVASSFCCSRRDEYCLVTGLFLDTIASLDDDHLRELFRRTCIQENSLMKFLVHHKLSQTNVDVAGKIIAIVDRLDAQTLTFQFS